MSERSYKTNKNIVFSCKYHVVFCPKYRRSVLIQGVDERFKELVKDLAVKMNFEVLEQEVRPDHVYLLIDCDPQFGIHRVIKTIKGVTSKALRNEFPWLKSRLPSLWTNSYFVATVGGAPVSIVKQYIESQKWTAENK